MSGFVLTERAETDLRNIWDYIAARSVDAADKVIVDFHRAFDQLAENPEMGHRRRDVRNRRYRFWRVHRFIIAYFPETRPMQIIRIVGGQRNFRPLFRKG